MDAIVDAFIGHAESFAHCAEALNRLPLPAGGPQRARYHLLAIQSRNTLGTLRALLDESLASITDEEALRVRATLQRIQQSVCRLDNRLQPPRWSALAPRT